MKQIIHFESKDEYQDNSSGKYLARLQERMHRAHLVSYLDNDGNYFIVRNRNGESNTTLHPHEYYYVVTDLLKKKVYTPKFPIGYKYGQERGTNWIKEIVGFGALNGRPTYKTRIICNNRSGEDDAQNIDEGYVKLFKLITPHIEQLNETSQNVAEIS